MSDDGYAPGPIAWADLELPDEPGASGAFEDLLARALLEAPDADRAIDATRIEATPTDPADTDGGDDRDLIDGAAEIAEGVAHVRDFQATDEIAALDGIDPAIAAGAQDVADAGDDPGLDYMDTTLPDEGGQQAPVPNPWPFPRSPPPGQ